MSNETKAASAAATNNMKTGATSKVRFITVTAMLSAISFVLMYFEFPIPILPAFIKFDVSALPALFPAQESQGLLFFQPLSQAALRALGMSAQQLQWSA